MSVGSFSPLRCILDLPADASRPVMQAGGEEFIISGGGALVDPREGTVLWHTGLDSYHRVGDGYLVGRQGGDREKGLVCYRISKTEAKRLWSPDAKYGPNAYRLPSIYNGRVWASAGGGNAVESVFSVELATGELLTGKPFWGAGNPNRSSSSVVMTGNRMFLERADLVHVDETAVKWIKFEELPEGRRPTHAQRIPGHNDLIVANTTAPSVSDGRLYLRLRDGLACLDLRKTPKAMQSATLRRREGKAEGAVAGC